jgi:putative transposase
MVDMREVLNALLYMVMVGGAWRMLPHDFPKWQTVYDYFRLQLMMLVSNSKC